MSLPPIEIRDLGLDVDYDEALGLQAKLVEQRKADLIPDQLLVLQHKAVITIPRERAADNLLLSPERAEDQGVQVRRTNRGGDITYHGPGQWVLYPILKLQGAERDVHAHARKLEQSMIDVCVSYGLDAQRVEGLTGTWVGNAKIGAIGLRFSRWVSSHGLAFNDLLGPEQFDFIVPCGIRDRGICSLASLGVEGHRVREQLVEAVLNNLNRQRWNG